MHETRHVAEMGWKGKSNGELLRLAVAEGFDVLVTGDTHLPYQKDLAEHNIAVIEIRPERLVLQRLIPMVPALLDAIQQAPKRALTTVA